MITAYRVWSKLASGETVYGEWGKNKAAKEAFAAHSKKCEGVFDSGVEVSEVSPDKAICLPGEPEYKLSEWLGFPDEKITEILKRSGSGPSEIAASFLGINELRRHRDEILFQSTIPQSE